MKAAIEIGLHATIVAIDKATPYVLTVTNQEGQLGLPFGPFQPQQHRTLEAGLRAWVTEQSQLKLGYVEQLYTFGDAGRGDTGDVNFISIGYLALVRHSDLPSDQGLEWSPWYRHFPWEDWRDGQPALLQERVLPMLKDWAASHKDDRVPRVRLAFGCTADLSLIDHWDEERALERYELMYEAGLLDEAVRDGHFPHRQIKIGSGIPLVADHRRILATAIARLRSKLKYRPIVFEILPDTFTLTELQRTAETLSGRRVHKQNFRRMVENAKLVEPTGATAAQTGGRPAAIFRFRRDILRERPAPGLKV